MIDTLKSISSLKDITMEIEELFKTYELFCKKLVMANTEQQINTE